MTSPTYPKVFISYSHDSDKHKDWVRRLAERLCIDGVDILLDQWEIGPGDDVTAFMERALSSCARVLIICTDTYIQKANTLTGGVGYERMIITAEIARDLETRKFIPILRNIADPTLPDFLGPRIYVDLRIGDFDEAQYDVLLRELHQEHKYKKPTLGRSPYVRAKTETSQEGEIMATDDSVHAPTNSSIEIDDPTLLTPEEWSFHWHRAVHEYCGCKLHLILLRFTSGSIFMKNSIIADLRHANISDFMIFHLFSVWDVLIRVWADDQTIQLLRNRFLENSDVHKDRKPEFIMVQELTHFPEMSTYADTPDIAAHLDGRGLALLKDVQDKGVKSKYFQELSDAGLVLDGSVGFTPTRIQFYITIRSMYSLEAPKVSRLKELIAEWQNIYNRSVYLTEGSSIRAIIKGQSDEYYEIDRFLRAITRELASGEVVTETILVASPNVLQSTRIDFERADAYLIEYELEKLIPELGPASVLRVDERWKLIAKYVEIREMLQEDKQKVLVGLIRAKAKGSAQDVGRLLTFFPSFEEKLRQRLVPLLVRLYGNDWQKALDELKDKEGVKSKKRDDLVFGDLCRLYKRIVLEKHMIDITPLSDVEFTAIMDAAPGKRNDFAHREPDLKHWDDLFSFCSRFIPIQSRLLADIDSHDD